MKKLFTIIGVALSLIAPAQCAKFQSSNTLVIEHADGTITNKPEKSIICVYTDEVHIETSKGFTVYKAQQIRENGSYTFYTCDGCEVIVKWESCEGCMIEVIDGPYNRYVYQNIRRI